MRPNKYYFIAALGLILTLIVSLSTNVFVSTVEQDSQTHSQNIKLPNKSEEEDPHAGHNHKKQEPKLAARASSTTAKQLALNTPLKELKFKYLANYKKGDRVHIPIDNGEYLIGIIGRVGAFSDGVTNMIGQLEDNSKASFFTTLLSQ